jgi:hypothetical protein
MKKLTTWVLVLMLVPGLVALTGCKKEEPVDNAADGMAEPMVEATPTPMMEPIMEATPAMDATPGMDATPSPPAQ